MDPCWALRSAMTFTKEVAKAPAPCPIAYRAEKAAHYLNVDAGELYYGDAKESPNVK